MAKKLSVKTLIIVILLLLIGGLIYLRFFSNKTLAPQYLTAQAAKGTLVTSVSASGTISSGASADITTSASGTVKNVYVKNGDSVIMGQKIADLTLDESSQQKQAAAWVSYLNAVNNQSQAEQNKLSLEIQTNQGQQALNSAQNAVNNMNSNSINPATHATYTDLEKQNINLSLIQAQQSLALTGMKYYAADANINSAKAGVSSAWYSYQQNSSTITASIAGTVNDLSLIAGLPLGSSSSSSGQGSSSSASSSSNKIGTITLSGVSIQTVVNLTEINTIKVKPGQKVTLILDAYPNQTFTGVVTSIDTNGQVSSGVTTYPATITLDKTTEVIYPNMAVTAKIITNVKDNVLLVPSSAIQTANGQSSVRVMQNNQVTSVAVSIGDSNDIETEITSGLNDGEMVVTSVINQTSSSSQTSSPFSGLGGARGFGGSSGGAVRVGRSGG